MKLENQVCSLSLAQRLESLGVKQESAFFWCNFGKNDWRGPYFNGDTDWLTHAGTSAFTKDECRDLCSAFTVAELGEMLPPNFVSTKRHPNDTFSGLHKEPFWCYDGSKEYTAMRTEYADTEADARAKMLIYLLEYNLITP